MSWYRKAAEQGNASAQTDLARMYNYGEGVTQDHSAAVSWYRKAAEQGHADAQNNLGAMYDEGTGVPQDYVQAHKWYNLAGAGAEVAEVRDQAIKNRDIVSAKMQPAQIAEAQRLASEWRRK
jgi:TPR repeat protein